MKFNPAYTNRQPYYSQSNPTPGAYLIKYNGEIKYVGFSTYNVVKTAYRHFQKWQSDQYRATFPKSAGILIFPTKTAKRAKQLERMLQLKYNRPGEYP